MKSLKNKSKIDELFTSNSKKIYTSTIKAIFTKDVDSEVLISVPIKIFKKAVNRNKIKRLMRESIRLNMIEGFTIAFIYNSNKIEDFKTINKDIKKIFENIK